MPPMLMNLLSKHLLNNIKISAMFRGQGIEIIFV